MAHNKFSLFAVAGIGFVATATFNTHGVTRWPAGYREMVVPVPLETPRGAVELASYGVAELTPADGPPLATLHVRMKVWNEGANVPWTVDFSRASLAIPGEPRLVPTFINADISTLPLVILDRGERATADLYFAVPRWIKADADLPAFDVSWQIATPDRTIESRTRFEHARKRSPLELAPVPALGAPHRWWFDPAYPWSTYYHRPGHAVPRPPRTVTITRLPRFGHAR